MSEVAVPLFEASITVVPASEIANGAEKSLLYLTVFGNRNTLGHWHKKMTLQSADQRI